jgi:3-hydroxyisobutyrate dehydrogenase-like beta-hydroxyacid dehydrogenase
VIGLVGAGYMGSGLAVSLMRGGHGVAQRAAGLTPDLFEAFATVYADIAGTALAAGKLEEVVNDAPPVSDVLADLRRA